MRIKRFILSLVVAFSMLFSGIILTACDDNQNLKDDDKPFYMVSVSGLADDVVLGGAYDTSAATARVLFESGAVATIANSELDFGDPIDTTSVGEQVLTISYTKFDKTVGFDKTVEVYADSVTKFEVTSYTKNIENGETYSFDDVVAKLTYRSGKTEILSAEDLNFSPATIDTTENGVKEITVFFKEDSSLNVKLDVYVYTTDAVSSITKVEGLEKEVWEGTTRENYDVSNAIASVLRTTGVVNEVESKDLTFDYSHFNTDIAGTTYVKVLYTEGDITVDFDFEITVKSNVVVDKQVVEGSFLPQINMGDEFDTSNVKLKLIFADGSEQVVDTNLTVNTSNIDTYDEGIQQFTVVTTYNNEEYVATGEVNVVKNYTIMGVDSPSFVSAYNKNSQLLNTYNSTNSNGVKGFTVIGKKYAVGDDNKFSYDLNITAIANSTTAITQSFKLTYKIYIVEYDMEDDLQIEKRTLLKDDSAESKYKTSTYIEIDDFAHTLQFNENAIGKTFYISVLPKYVSEEEIQEYLISASTLTIEVVDGYNVYNAKDFSLLDNVNAGGKWNDVEGYDIDAAKSISAIVLHSDIAVEEKDIPQTHFEIIDGKRYLKNRDMGYSDSAESLDNPNAEVDNGDLYGAIYRRSIKDGEQFAIKGNYFTISAAKLPYFKNNEDKTKLGYSAFLVAEGYKQDKLSSGKFYVEDVSLFGNAQKPSDSGDGSIDSDIGLMFLKARNIVSYITNNLSQSWYMSYMFRGPDYNTGKASCYDTNGNLIDEGSLLGLGEDEGLVNIDGVTAYDAYNTLLYLQGAGNVSIKNSTMIGAGGPVMIVDHAIDGNSNNIHTGRPCFVVVEDCKFESLVEGTEAWFNSLGVGALAIQLKALNAVLSGVRSQVAPLFESIKDGISQAETAYNDNIDSNQLDIPKIDLSKYKNMLDYLDSKSIMFYNSSTKTNSMLNLIAVFKSDNTIGIESPDNFTASTYTDISKELVDDEEELVYKNGFDQSKSTDSNYTGKVILEGFDSLVLAVNNSLNGLDYFLPMPALVAKILSDQIEYTTEDFADELTNMIGKLIAYETEDTSANNGEHQVDISDFEALIEDLKPFNDAFNDLETYLGLHLFNNMGVLLGILSTPWYRAN